ncbi:MAG: Holliday junction branch migration protein RuvA [Clostridiales bacterium]|nr:Holliday junction branch migration protein RuvA [Clostridiales bacterium]
MISYIKGTIEEIGEDEIVMESQGIGYSIRVPQSVIRSAVVSGQVVKIYTYLYVREDALNLYGFLTKDDLSVFKMLITVNGIGPKGAIGILSNLSADDLRFAVLSDDAKAIAKAPGVGIKTAGKVILELKDRMKLEDAFEKKLEHTLQGEGVSQTAESQMSDAVSALVALGYGSTEAMKAVRSVQDGGAMDAEQLLKAALKNLI